MSGGIMITAPESNKGKTLISCVCANLYNYLSRSRKCLLKINFTVIALLYSKSRYF